MSWDAYLTDDRGHSEGEWNVTHNLNGMIEKALAAEGVDLDATGTPFWAAICAKAGTTSAMGSHAWWDLLDGLPGTEGAALLDRIIRGLEADPAGYRAMNPENGWGSYDSLLEVLRSMRAAVPEWPTTWSASG